MLDRPESRFAFADMLAALAASGEATRLRILALVAEAELTVTELVSILGQSQPRVSRHLKLLVEGGLIVRHREGAWAFFRLAEGPIAQAIRGGIVQRLHAEDPVIAADRRRLEAVRAERKDQAASYFAEHAEDWGRIRALHVEEARVEAAVLELLGDAPIQSLLDLGTGTGQMLKLLAPRAPRAIGLDISHAMLKVARALLDQAGLRHVQLRQGDAYAVPPDLQWFDLVIVHQVLHYLDDPARAIREAARALRPGGRLLVVDFAPHSEEVLRSAHAHRRLGFADAEIEGFLLEAGLQAQAVHAVTPGPGEKAALSVTLWLGRDPRLLGDFPDVAPSFAAIPTFASPSREVA